MALTISVEPDRIASEPRVSTSIPSAASFSFRWNFHHLSSCSAFLISRSILISAVPAGVACLVWPNVIPIGTISALKSADRW